MTRLRSLRPPSLLLALLLAGCQTALPLVSRPSPQGSLLVELDVRRQVQATVSRNLVAMIDHYTATLLKWDGTSFVPLVTPLSSTTTELVRPKFAFDHLGPGRYQVRAIGYNASNAPLTSEGSADVDLTGNNVDLAPQVTVPLSMLPVVFSATLPLPSNAVTPGSVPAWATSLEAVVSVGGTEIARHSYTPGQAASLKNMAAGVSYDVTVTASNGLGYSDDDSYTYAADPTATSLDDAPSHVFSWTAPGPVITTYAVGTYPFDLTLDAAGNVWVPNRDSNNVTRISSTGSISTFTVGTGPRKVAVDASGNAWVANYTTNNVTRISPTGSLSTFTVGTNPKSVAVDASGNAWVANVTSEQLNRISSTGSISTFAGGGDPYAVAIDASGNAWFPNFGASDVTRISATGSISTFIVGTSPYDITIDASGNAWVPNYGSANVTRISTTGSISTYAAGTNPRGVKVDGAGNAWVVNYGSANVTRISATGSISTFTAGTNPFAVALDASGNAWVTNNNSANVTRISTTGSISTYAVGTNPRSVQVDAAGNAWVANSNSNNVTKIHP